MIKRLRKSSIVLSCLLLAQVLTTSADGADILFLSGAEGGWAGSHGNYYGFAAAVAPLPGSTLGGGLVQKYWVDLLGYEYPSGDQDVTATAVGLEGALGFQRSGPNGWAGAYAGVRYSNTWLSPDNPGSSVRGSQVRPKFQLEGERRIADFKVNGIISYVPISDGYWGRIQGLRRLHDDLYTGPEFIGHGDPDYRAWQIGWVLTGFEPLPGARMGVKGGARITEGSDTGGYLGVEFSKIF